MFGAEPAGDFFLGFGGAQVSFGLVGGRWDAQVGDEAEDVVLAVAQVFQEPLAVLAVVEAGGAGAGGQAGGDGVAVGGDQRCGGGRGDGGQALSAGLVRGVDQAGDGGGDLGWPGGAWVGLGGVFQVAQQVGVMPISA